MKNIRLIIHGENIQASRLYLSQILSQLKEFEVISLSGPSLLETNLVTAVESTSMFSNNRLVVLETIFGGIKSIEKKKIIHKLSEYGQDFNVGLIIWENKTLTKTVLKQFLDWEIKNFPLSKSLFQFLDSFYPGSQTLFLQFQKTLASEPIQLLFYMLHRRVSALIQAIYKTDSFFKASPWQQSKILQQAQKFGIDSLIDIYRNLRQIEINQKTGGSAVSLETELSLFLAKL